MGNRMVLSLEETMERFTVTAHQVGRTFAASSFPFFHLMEQPMASG